MGNVPLEETVAFLAEPGMPNQFLGTFGGLHSAAFAINDLGQVVGWAETVAGIRRAFVTRLPGINPPGAPRFLRGDCNSDGEVTGVVSDAIFLLTFNFLGGQRPDCLAACDANGDGEVTGVVTDAINILTHNFLGGPPPVEPFPDCGPGALPDDERLGCAAPPASCAGG
jgi:uncharacterized membrane protein